MLDILKKLRAAPTSAADLRAALAEAEAGLPAAEAKVQNAEAKRSAGLLELSDPELEKIEAELRLAVRDRDRLKAARAELERRASEAESAELVSRLDAQRNAIEKRAAAFAKALPAKYDALAAPLVDLLNELIEIDREIARVNEADQEAARDGKVGPRIALTFVEDRANRHRNSSAFHAGSWLALTSILATDRQAGFGAGRHLMAMSGRLATAQQAAE